MISLLVICPECNSRISSEANPCPHCGFPNAGGFSEKTCWVLARFYNARRGDLLPEGKYYWSGQSQSGDLVRIVDARLQKRSLGVGYCVILNLKSGYSKKVIILDGWGNTLRQEEYRF